VWRGQKERKSYNSIRNNVILAQAAAKGFLRRKEAGANPWGPGATTLEWTLPSPPPYHSFEELPRIR